MFICSIKGHLGCWQFGTVVLRAAKNVLGKFLCRYTFLLLLSKYLRVELLGHTVDLCLTFYETAVFQKWLCHFTPYHKVWSSSYSSSLSTFDDVSLFKLVTLVGEKWHLVRIWMCISLVSSNVDHLWMYLLAIGLSSFVKFLYEPFAHLKNWIVYFCYQFVIVS